MLSAQIKATIDSITYSNKVEIQRDPLEVVLYSGKPLPLMLVNLSIINESEERIRIANRDRPTLFFRYFYRAKPSYDGSYYYLPARILNKPYNTEDEFYESRPQIIQPGHTLKLTLWARPSLKDIDINQDSGLIPTDYSNDDLICWFDDVLRNFKVVIYYGFETGEPKILISGYFDKSTAPVRIEVD